MKDGESKEFADLFPEPYTVEEFGESGWDLTNIGCSSDQGAQGGSTFVYGRFVSGSFVNGGSDAFNTGDTTAEISLAAGDEVTCTYTNQADAFIIVEKQTDPNGDPQVFEFDPSWGANFFLSDGQTNNSGDLEPGTYSVSEVNLPSGWELDHVTCTEGTPGSISLQAGETITCTFYNEDGAFIVVKKETNPDGSTTQFEFDPSWAANFFLADGGQHSSGDLNPGTYSVIEVNLPPDWDLESAVCSDGSNAGSISLQAGETVTCTFNNKFTGDTKILTEVHVTCPGDDDDDDDDDGAPGIGPQSGDDDDDDDEGGCPPRDDDDGGDDDGDDDDGAPGIGPQSGDDDDDDNEDNGDDGGLCGADDDGEDVTGLSLPLGTAVHDCAFVSLADGSIPPVTITGQVTYKLFIGNCGSGTLAMLLFNPGGPFPGTQTVTMSGGLVPASSSTLSLPAGLYGFQAFYLGNHNFNPSDGVCEPFTIEKAGTTTLTAVHADCPGDGDEDDDGAPGIGPQHDDDDESGCPPRDDDDDDDDDDDTDGVGPKDDDGGDDDDDDDDGGDDGGVLCGTDNEEDVTGRSLPLGTAVHDCARVTGAVDGFPLTGTITYQLFSSINCQGTSITQGPFALGTESPLITLGAGSYGYIATYSGDGNYSGSTGVCERFTIEKAGTTTLTAVHADCPGDDEDVDDEGGCSGDDDDDDDDDTDGVDPNDDDDDGGDDGGVLCGTDNEEDVTGRSLPLGTAVHDCARVTGAVDGFPLTGTITYQLFSSINCQGTSITQGPFALGTESPTSTPDGGSYGYRVTFTPGDGNYSGSTGVCEPFTIGKVDTRTLTAVHADCPGDDDDDDEGMHRIGPRHDDDEGGCRGDDDRDGEGGDDDDYEDFDRHDSGILCGADREEDMTGRSLPLGTTVHDCARVTGAVEGFPLTGTIAYNLYSNGNCQGASFFEESLPVGTESSPMTLGPGSYSYRATYSGDDSYFGSTGACESFSIKDGKFIDDGQRQIRKYWDDDGGDDDRDDEDDEWSSCDDLLGVSIPGSATVRDEIGAFLRYEAVRYESHPNDECSGSPFPAKTVPVGSEPSAIPARGSGSDSSLTTSSGDSTYTESTSDYASFTLDRARTTEGRTVHDPLDSDNKGSSVPLGTAVHESSTVLGEVSNVAISSSRRTWIRSF